MMIMHVLSLKFPMALTPQFVYNNVYKIDNVKIMKFGADNISDLLQRVIKGWACFNHLFFCLSL